MTSRESLDIFSAQTAIQTYYVQHNFQMIEYCQLISPHDPEHPDYNRGITGINRKKVEYIKANFDEKRVNPPTVSLRNGKYYIIDGQHTSVAIYELNGSDPHCLIQCKVLTGLSHEDEAKMFVDMNVNIQKLSIPDKIWALSISGDEDAKQFVSIIKINGYEFEIKCPKQISAISECWTIFNDDRTRLAEILRVLNRAWPDDGSATSAVMMGAMSYFMACHGDDYDADWLVRRLSETNHKKIEEQAKYDNENSRDKYHDTKKYCGYREIVSRYNHNRTKKNRLRLWDPRIDGPLSTAS